MHNTWRSIHCCLFKEELRDTDDRALPLRHSQLDIHARQQRFVCRFCLSTPPTTTIVETALIAYRSLLRTAGLARCYAREFP